MMQSNLFGEPPLRPELSQWHTPPWLARRLAEWVPRGAHVLEPACGAGNLIAALLELKHDPARIVGNDLDEEWGDYCAARFAGAVRVFTCDALAEQAWHPRHDSHFEVVLMNPPFENGLHAAFVARALELAPLVVMIAPSSIEFGQERDRELWATKARVVRRARCPARVDYGGSDSPSFDTVALKIRRRDAPRPPNEVCVVPEEVWLP